MNLSLLKRMKIWLKPTLTKNDLLACAASGILLSLPFPPWEYYLFIWIALVPLFYRIQYQEHKANAWRGFITGLIYYAGLLFWLYHVTIPGMILLILLHAFIYAVLAVLTGVLFRRWYGIPLIALIWSLFEFLQQIGPFSFAWGFLGHSLFPWVELLQITPWMGVAGLSFFIVTVNLSISELFVYLQKNWKVLIEKLRWDFIKGNRNFAAVCLLCGLFVIVLLHGYGRYVIRTYESSFGRQGCPPCVTNREIISYRVALIQGNFKQDVKQSLPVKEALHILLELSRSSLAENPDLIVWPESSIPVPINYWPSIVESINNFVEENEVDLLVGAVYGEYGSDKDWTFYNRALFFTPGLSLDFSDQSVDLSSVLFYDKMHLVPYGEWVPLGEYWPFGFIETLIEEAGAGIFEPGQEQTIFTTEKGVRFAVAICFESTLAGQLAEAGQMNVDFLINITNDAWFKKSPGLKQHFIQSIFRAAENRCYVLRAANTGISGVIDPTGQVVKRIPTHQQGYCVYEMELDSN